MSPERAARWFRLERGLTEAAAKDPQDQCVRINLMSVRRMANRLRAEGHRDIEGERD